LTHSDMRELWSVTSADVNLSLLEQMYGVDGLHFEDFDQVLAKEIGCPQKVHFTVKAIQDDRPRGWGRIELTEITRPLQCTLFFPDGAMEMSAQVFYLILRSAFDCDGYSELELRLGKLSIDPGGEATMFGVGLIHAMRNQHMDRTRSTTTDIYTYTSQQWRILKKCMEAWLSSLGTQEV